LESGTLVIAVRNGDVIEVGDEVTVTVRKRDLTKGGNKAPLRLEVKAPRSVIIRRRGKQPTETRLEASNG
jgi:sRNA-binding carbon storage regulator CsrA